MNSTQKTNRGGNRVPVIILNGFLGAGKTTLLRHLLVQAHEQKLDVSVIVNDMSELDVDGGLVADTDVVGREEHNLVSIYADSLSSKTGIPKLENALNDILSHRRADLILIETSGSSHPLPLIEFFQSQKGFELRGVLALADSVMLDQDFAGGQHLIPRFQTNLQQGRRDTVNLLAEQILFSSHLLLTKADRLAPGKLEKIAGAIHPLNPYVAIMAVTWGSLSVDELLAFPEYNYQRIAQLSREIKPMIDIESEISRPYNMATRVIKDDRPFHPQRLWEACHRYLGQGIYRSKGYFWLPGRDKISLLWNQAAGSINLQLVGYWRSGIVENPNNGLLPDELELLKERVVKESGRFGDRLCNLTVIGDRSQVDAFTDALKSCFLTEDEIRFWQNGGEFPDPWPQKLLKINERDKF